MLTAETKRKIDNARDILVGKVPDPKAQVEQITTALIYKFMDDMDKRAASLPKGKPSFFTNGFEKFSWSKLLSPRLTGQERWHLYDEALKKMSKNPHIQAFFQDIFKDAFLPYRDPETLSLFLKQINDFEYDHSENLGDAFEYLLSVLGSQGDAGQFRTPRHIIDFIVEVLDPKKDETILDPACGTAGFLISAYKHILKENNKKPLTPDEKKRLMNNLTGYDISPDMVKLSLVNMYLHGFPSPSIHEYDTLTSDERWDERFDVMMANPPFMSPKGGIRPHKRFAVQANRAEVLFVDYIMEHLNSKGRAGIIVPEGIIFQSATAYKELRRLLVADGLYAVVSLPAGVFNPYATVKTSILFFDNQLSKKTKEVLFIKVQNDGFDLGAQRRPIDRNDLPYVATILKARKDSILKGKKNYLLKKGSLLAWTVPKTKITKTEDHSLSGDRYNNAARPSNNEWESVKIKDVCEINPPKTEVNGLSKDTLVSFVPMADLKEHKMFFDTQEKKKLGEVIKGYTYFKDNDVLLAKITPCFENGKSGVAKELTNGIGFGSTEFFVLRPNDKVLPKWIYHFISQERFINEGKKNMTGSAGQQRLVRDFLSNYVIPLPPIEKQKEILEEFDGYQKVIDGGRQIIEHHKPAIKIEPSWDVLKIGDLCTLMTGGTPRSTEKKYYGGDIKWLVSGDIHKGEIYDCEGRITKEGMKNSNTKFLPMDSVLIALNGQGKTRGTVALLKTEATCNQSIVAITPEDKTKLKPEFLFYLLKGMYQEIRDLTGDKQRSGLNMNTIRNIRIPVAPLETQEKLVKQFEEEKKHIESASTMVEIYENKIKNKIAEIWGE